MTIITESLISECQNQRTILLNNLIDKSFKKTAIEALNYNIFYDIKHKDFVKLLKNNLIKDICSLKHETTIINPIFYIDEENLAVNKEEFSVVIDVIQALELFKREKSKNFFKNFIKYLKKNDLVFLKNVYFKQVSNKHALFK